ncbi:MAG: chromate transporter [Peptococcia bacterium]|jgi:chromate transporter
MLWLLFKTFFLIGLFGFGGGYAMLPLIQKEIVFNHAWLTAQQFTDIIAVAEITPGPIAINTATYVGYQVAGLTGSVLATLGVVFPSFILITTLANIVLKNKNNPYFQGVFHGLRPVVVALIIGAAIYLGLNTITTAYNFFLTLIALALFSFTKIHPILLLLGFGLLNVFICML